MYISRKLKKHVHKGKIIRLGALTAKKREIIKTAVGEDPNAIAH
jgi:hypothetical protein